METLNRILDLLEVQNKKQKDLTDYLGITKNAFTDWKSGRIKSYTKYLPQIADYFNCSVDFLLGRKETVSTNKNDSFIERENKKNVVFWNRFYNLCLKNNTRPNPVAKAVGISSGVLSKWKNENTIPNGEALLKIADYFDCSIDYLLGHTDEVAVNRGETSESVVSDKAMNTYLKSNPYTSHDIAKKIKECAKGRGISLKEVLRKCGLGENTFSHMLHGRAIAFDSLAKIADCLDCSVDYLLGRTDEVLINNTKNNFNQIDVSFEQNKLTILFEKMSYENKQKLLEYAEMLHEYSQMKM